MIYEFIAKESRSPQNSKPKEDAGETGQQRSETEFVSDTFQTSDKDLAEVKEGMKKLGIDTLATEANKEVKKDDIKTGKVELSD
jgi:hypothetical protein